MLTIRCRIEGSDWRVAGHRVRTFEKAQRQNDQAEGELYHFGACSVRFGARWLEGKSLFTKSKHS